MSTVRQYDMVFDEHWKQWCMKRRDGGQYVPYVDFEKMKAERNLYRDEIEKLLVWEKSLAREDRWPLGMLIVDATIAHLNKLTAECERLRLEYHTLASKG